MKLGNQYKKGANKERAFIKLQYRRGARLAVRTAGSHSPVDVIVIGQDMSYRLYQLKAGAKPSKQTVKEWREDCERTGLDITLLWWADRAKEPVPYPQNALGSPRTSVQKEDEGFSMGLLNPSGAVSRLSPIGPVPKECKPEAFERLATDTLLPPMKRSRRGPSAT